MIRHGDALAVLRTMGAGTFDGCLTDPPYGLAFMGAAWDHGVPGAEVWAEVLRVLKPGAFLLAFGGTRTYHRLTCAIEDAGFEIRDCLMWMYGSGFPKAKSCLKPAYEPILLARKRGPMLPLAIDASRIGTESTQIKRPPNSLGRMNDDGWKPSAGFNGSTLGRWPANVILDPAAAAALDAQSGDLGKSSGTQRRTSASWLGERRKDVDKPIGFGDSGGASRFFYCAKASPSERGANAHPCVKPLKLTEYLARLILPAGGGRLIVPFAGSGSEMLGAKRAGWKVTGIEREAAYVATARERMKAAA